MIRALLSRLVGLITTRRMASAALTLVGLLAAGAVIVAERREAASEARSGDALDASMERSRQQSRPASPAPGWRLPFTGE